MSSICVVIVMRAIFEMVLDSRFVHSCQFLSNLLGLFGSKFAHFSGHISTNFQYINIHQIDYFGNLTQKYRKRAHYLPFNHHTSIICQLNEYLPLTVSVVGPI